MKMRPTANSDEYASADRPTHVARYTEHSSRRPREQVSASRNAHAEYETHLSQNAAYSSTYELPGGGISNPAPADQHVAYHERSEDGEEDQRDATRNSERAEQRHKSVDTRDIESPRRSKKSCCPIKLRLFCLRLCRAKRRCSERVFVRRTRRVLERVKARGKECRKPDDTVAVAVGPYREEISHRDAVAPKKSRRSRKRDEAVEDTDAPEDTREERKERRRREREERKRMDVETEEERRERKERRGREERVPLVPHPVEARLVALDAPPRDDLPVVEDRAPVKPPPPPPSLLPSIADFAKSCCYLCAQNTLAITAAVVPPKPEQSDKSVQVSAREFHLETAPPTLDKRCSPILLVRTVQSFVRVKTRETGTLCPDAGAVPRGEIRGPRARKRRKFALLFPGLTRTKCPAGRPGHAACATDKPTVIVRRDDNAEEREPRNDRCCRERD